MSFNGLNMSVVDGLGSGHSSKFFYWMIGPYRY